MDMPRNTFKHAIAKGQLQIGLWCSLCSPVAIEVVSHSGYDWLLLDTDRWTASYRRAEYDIAGAQAAIRAANLPDSLAERLQHGQ